MPKIWQGGDVWIIGGGPSLFQQFAIPNDLVNAVMRGQKPISQYSPYFESIHSKHIIGINIAYLIGNWVDFVYFGDASFFLKHKERLFTFPGLKISSTSNITKYKWIKYVQLNGGKPFGISNDPTKVSWNGSSGAAAINLAHNAGAKRVFLLGFDMKLDNSKNQHWHGEYRGHRIDSSTLRKNLPFAKHLKGFPAIKKDADAYGLQIFNVSPQSAIEDFPKITLNEALNL